MGKKIMYLVVILIATLGFAGIAQAASIEDMLEQFYVDLNAALKSGDTSQVLTWFADDATMEVGALAPQPVKGKDMIGAAMFPGMLAAVGGATITTVSTTVDGNTATVYNMYTGGKQGDFPIQEIIVFNTAGKIQSYTVNVGVPPPAPVALPTSGGAILAHLSLLAVAVGGAFAVLGQQLRRH
jgi:ketosteroid isomerase-like protein